MSSKKKHFKRQIFEFRVKYNAGAGHSALDSYHYYSAESAEQALSYLNIMMEKHGFTSQTISVEKKNPYASRWEDESQVVGNNEV
jgi:hypothetical protein